MPFPEAGAFLASGQWKGPGSGALTRISAKRSGISEAKRVQFRVDALNVFTHPEPATPILDINDANFGRITGVNAKSTISRNCSAISDCSAISGFKTFRAGRSNGRGGGQREEGRIDDQHQSCHQCDRKKQESPGRARAFLLILNGVDETRTRDLLRDRQIAAVALQHFQGVAVVRSVQNGPETGNRGNQWQLNFQVVRSDYDVQHLKR